MFSGAHKKVVQLSELIFSIMIISICLLAFPEHAVSQTTPPDHVILQLKWYPQFQFAGYYMALARGFYREANLIVTIVPMRQGISPAMQVESGKAQFGIGSVDILRLRAQGHPLVSIAAIMQHSADCMMVPASSSIRSFTDLAGKHISVTRRSPEDIEMRVVMKKEGGDPSRIVYMPHTPSLKAFMQGKADAYAAYITNEPLQMKEKHFPVRILRAIDYGIDFYGDCVFTSDQFAKEHPEIVERFRQATLRGWDYAMAHPGETTDYLLKNFKSAQNPLTRKRLMDEAHALTPLISPSTILLGHQSPERWNLIQKMLLDDGLIKKTIPINDFIWTDPGEKNFEQVTLTMRYTLYAFAAVGLIALFISLTYFYINRQLVRAIDQAKRELEIAHADLDMRGKTLHSLLELGQSLSGVSNANTLIESILQQVREGFGVKTASLFILSPDHLTLSKVINQAQDNAEDQTQITVQYDESLDPDDALNAIAPNLHGSAYPIFVPLIAGGEPLGLLEVEEEEGKSLHLSNAEIIQLRGFADEIALAFYNARLLNESENQQILLAKSNRQLQTLVDFGRAANLARSQEEVVHRIAEAIKGYGFDRVEIYLVENDIIKKALATDEDGNEYVPENINESSLDQPDPLYKHLLQSAEEYHYTKDYYAEEGIMFKGKPVRHHMTLILRAHDRVICLISADNALTERAFDIEDIAPLLPFSRHAAVILDNVRLLSALRRQEEFSRTLITSISETIYSMRVEEDQTFTPTYFSPQIEHLCGYTSEEVMQNPTFWQMIIHPDDRQRFLKSLQDMLKEEPYPIEFRFIHKNGQLRWGLAHPVFLRDEHGETHLVHGTFLDITERKDLEDRLLQSQKMETIGTLAGGIAHEFNNLLAIMSGNVEMARMDIDDNISAAHSLDQTMRAIHRAADLTRQLLTFSRKTDIHKTPLSVDEVIRETVKLLAPTIGRNIIIEIRNDPDIGSIEGDAGQIEQVLINLCVNARDAMPEGGKIIIRAQNVRVNVNDHNLPANVSPGEYVRIQIHDTGIGIDPQLKTRVFDPFFTTKPVGRGTGLGLSVAYAIVQDHKGWIDIDSAPGVGSLFSIYLPSPFTHSQPQFQQGNNVQLTALVVDDNPIEREKLAQILEKEGYYPLTAADGSEALALFWTEGDRVSVIICSQSLPEMDSYQLIMHLRDYNPNVPIILATNEDDTIQNNETPKAALQTVHRPINSDEVTIALRKIMVKIP
jgi:PAS domain S-box-containing protein